MSAMERTCSKCGRNVPDGARFCGGCGLEMQATLKCYSCGSSNSWGNTFCQQCGSRIGNIAGTGLNTAELNAVLDFMYGVIKQASQLYLKVFPNLRNVKPVARGPFWLAAILGSLGAAICGLMVTFVVGILPVPVSVLRFVLYAVSFVVVTGLCGHLIFGRVLDAGYATPKAMSILGYISVVFAIAPLFGMAWASNLIAICVTIFFGSQPSVKLPEVEIEVSQPGNKQELVSVSTPTSQKSIVVDPPSRA